MHAHDPLLPEGGNNRLGLCEAKLRGVRIPLPRRRQVKPVTIVAGFFNARPRPPPSRREEIIDSVYAKLSFFLLPFQREVGWDFNKRKNEVQLRNFESRFPNNQRDEDLYYINFQRFFVRNLTLKIKVNCTLAA